MKRQWIEQPPTTTARECFSPVPIHASVSRLNTPSSKKHLEAKETDLPQISTVFGAKLCFFSVFWCPLSNDLSHISLFKDQVGLWECPAHFWISWHIFERTWNSRVFGLAMRTAEVATSSLSRRIFRPISSIAHNEKVRASVNPAAASSTRSRSDIFIDSCCPPIVIDRGRVNSMLLKPYAIAQSSMMSHACMTSERVGGIVTVSSPVSLLVTSDLRTLRGVRNFSFVMKDGVDVEKIIWDYGVTPATIMASHLLRPFVARFN